MTCYLKRASLNLPLLFVLTALSSCQDGGGNPAFTPAAVTPPYYEPRVSQGICPPGTEPFGYGCKPLSVFESRCIDGGGVLHDLDGARICRFGIPVLQNSSLPQLNGVFPRLINAESRSEAYDTGLEVLPGDYIYLTAQGGWGNTLNSGSYPGAYPLKDHLLEDHGCGEISLEGVDLVSGREIINPVNGLVSGLFASQGVEMLELNANGVPHRINARGRLALGFNSPFESGNCSNLRIHSLWIARCQDSLGTTLPCW